MILNFAVYRVFDQDGDPTDYIITDDYQQIHFATPANYFCSDAYHFPEYCKERGLRLEIYHAEIKLDDYRVTGTYGYSGNELPKGA